MNSADTENSAPELGRRSTPSESSATHACTMLRADEVELIKWLSASIGGSLGAGNGAVVIATPARRAALETVLYELGIDVTAVRSRGRYHACDASDIASKFMGSSLDENRFREVVSGLILHASMSGRGICAYSDLASVLLERGNGGAANRVTEIWHGLPNHFSFPLICLDAAGGATRFLDTEESSRFAQPGSQVVPSESRAATISAKESRRRATTARPETARSEIERRERDRICIERVRDELGAAAHAKDDFFAALSHELRTPLNPVLLLATEAAANPDLPMETRADFDVIARNVALEARLIDNLLDFTRIARGKLLLDKHPTDVCEIVRDAIAAVDAEMKDKRITFTASLGSKGETVLADPVRLLRVFWNVLKNAVKFTPEGGAISVALASASANRRIRITITDSGIGMTPEEIERLFFAFAQSEQAGGGVSGRVGGLGLGLVISRTLVELHGGSITATSAGPDGGSTFVIELPLDESRDAAQTGNSGATAASPMPARNVRAPGRFQRILLVEDHDSTRTALAHLLSRRGYEVLAAASVAAARALAADGGAIDFVISDVGLPDGNGYDLMNELRTSYGLSGLALSGYGMEEDITRSRMAGFVGHLTKPINIQSLEQALEAAVKIRDERDYGAAGSRRE